MGNDQQKPDFKKMSLESDFSTKELKDWYNKFKKDFPDGKVDKAKFSKLYMQLYPGDPTASKQFCDEMFKRYDSDRNGLVDFNEFMTSLGVASRGTATEKLLWVFQLYDKDSNGYLTKIEIINILTAFYKAKGVPNAGVKAAQIAQGAMEKCDDSKDGRLSEAEFVQHYSDCPEIKEMLSCTN